MWLDIPTNQNWFLTNQKIKNLWCQSSLGSQLINNTFRIFPNIPTALFETTVSLAQFYAHKRSVSLIKNQSPYQNFITHYFYKEAYSVQLSDLTLSDSELKKDQLFVFSGAQNPITSEQYDLSAIKSLLHDKKIAFIILNYLPNLENSIWQTVNSYEIHLHVLPNQSVLAIYGDKIKVTPLLNSFLPWPNPILEQIQILANPQTLSELNTQTAQQTDDITQFEQNLPAPLRAFHQQIQSNHQRFFDKAIIDCQNINADFLRQNLIDQLNQDKDLLNQKIQTTHLCHWQEREGFYDWYSVFPLGNLLFIHKDLLDTNSKRQFLIQTLMNLTEKSVLTWTL